jgi:prepilin-type N-terminal cleavage/methylation domain-containing protein
MHPTTQSAFTLAEMAIVLTIVGLLVGAIIGGDAVIRASELRSITRDFQLYQSATRTFSEKYNGLPGDIANATSYWGDDNAHCASAATSNGTPGTCNGDNDGTVETAAAASATGEYFEYWRQLFLAGLIPGTYSGIAGTGDGAHGVPGTNCPASKLGSTTGFCLYWYGNVSGSTDVYDDNYGHVYVFGKAKSSGAPEAPVLTADELANIDRKLDDGLPAFGKVKAFITSHQSGCSSSDTASSAVYAYMTSGAATCAAIFTTGF